VIVVDASVAVKWFVREEGHLYALRLLEQDHSLVAPDLIFSETANVLWKKLQKAEVTAEQSRQACRSLPEFFQSVISSAGVAVAALDLANRLNHSVYDCVYLSCAEQQGAKLVTADKKFISCIRNVGMSQLVLDLNEIANLEPASSDEVLSISSSDLAQVLSLAERFEATMKSVEDRVARRFGSGRLKWVAAQDLAPALGSPTRRRLAQGLGELSRDESRL
jgi:hypothetical protein